jgi:hypothetical protein
VVILGTSKVNVLFLSLTTGFCAVVVVDGALDGVTDSVDMDFD